jgi:hypothetical protein
VANDIVYCPHCHHGRSGGRDCFCRGAVAERKAAQPPQDPRMRIDFTLHKSDGSVVRFDLNTILRLDELRDVRATDEQLAHLLASRFTAPVTSAIAERIKPIIEEARRG